MAANMVLLEKITVGAAGASSVTFSGIPQTGYTDLVIKASSRTDRASTNDYFSMRFNGSTSGYTDKSLYGDGGAAQSETNNGTNNAFMFVSEGGNNTANTFGNHEIYIPNYTSANYKSVSSDGVSENNATGAIQGLNANLWSNTAAITSIVLFSIGTYVQYSTFYLYGVAALGTTPVIVPYATGGDTIMTDGTYWYHTFVSSGTFTPAKALTAHYLVVAGGGGGAHSAGGGGGAGGLRSTVTATGGGGSLESALSLASGTGYTVTVGAGGAGGLDPGVNGSNSVFSTITSTAGGGGAAFSSAGSSGGSGGGGSGSNNGGAGTANQGYAGGTGSGSVNLGGGGGGGAGAVGGNASTSVNGTGGAGVATSISGSSVTYAGGGGGAGNNATGAAGGAGGGGAGNSSGIGTAGTANLGAGGGGSNGSGTPGGAGGSGIVIVRYAV